MSQRHIRILIPAALGAVGVLALAPAAQADRPAGDDVAVVLTSGEVSPFTSVLPGCGSGTVSDAGAHVQFVRDHGMFNGSKVFACAGGAGGFTVHLSARFDQGGSTGSWAVTDAWGTQAGLHGAGSLVGIPFDGGIADHYLSQR